MIFDFQTRSFPIPSRSVAGGARITLKLPQRDFSRHMLSKKNHIYFWKKHYHHHHPQSNSKGTARIYFWHIIMFFLESSHIIQVIYNNNGH